jgi:hypothetical protein
MKRRGERMPAPMAETDKPRLLSGEIMAAAEKIPAVRPDALDVVEAEYETILPDASPRGERRPSSQPAAVPSPGGMDMLRGVGDRVEKAARGGPVFWSVGLSLVAAVFWVSGGHSLFEKASAAPYAAAKQPLSIEKVFSRVEPRGERDVLFVEGEARNWSGGTLAVPPIAIAITDGAGATSRHFLGTNGALLAPGERIGFSSRVEAPSNGVKTVTVTFRRE